MAGQNGLIKARFLVLTNTDCGRKIQGPVFLVKTVLTISLWCPPHQLQTSPEYGQGMNPISRLAQIQQAKKEKEPEYCMVTERGLPRRREFVMQVQ